MTDRFDGAGESNRFDGYFNVKRIYKSPTRVGEMTSVLALTGAGSLPPNLSGP